MKEIVIIQPAKIGDIIICLPIAKSLNDAGYIVHWPILRPYYEMFNRHIDYVNFTPLDNTMWDAIPTIKNIFKNYDMLDLSFYFPNTVPLSEQFSNQNNWSFDEFKYHIAKIDFNEKWNLKITRDYAREQALYDRLITNDYVVYQNRASDYKVNVNLNMGDYKYDIIELQEQTDDIFDWLTILEKAKKLVLIESCFSNLIDQLHIKTDKILLLKHGYYGNKLTDGTMSGMPRLREDWQLI